MRDLAFREASQRCHQTFGNSAAAYHERERQPPAAPKAKAPPAWVHDITIPADPSPPPERVVTPDREIYREILQCSDCRQFKKYDEFYKLAQQWSKAARRCMARHDDHHWVGKPVPIHEKDAMLQMP